MLTAATATRLAGALITPIGLAHFAMPTLGYRAADLAAIPAAQRAHFVDLGTYAIGSFLLAFAALAFVAAREITAPMARAFVAIMALVWAGRFALELVFPTRLGLFILDAPSPVLASFIALIAGLFALAALRLARD